MLTVVVGKRHAVVDIVIAIIYRNVLLWIHAKDALRSIVAVYVTGILVWVWYLAICWTIGSCCLIRTAQAFALSLER